ncbi:DEAD/DEAH box helicase [Vampirovibrio chlorellavorus]|uniref:DEAD/DEAH box helicase n=1 Tax=Vampirovibrio chlorellavorus TaxID=758823 RepID=UPI0026F14738|nr:DEAD/DEAH box helicase [Vampirovibrio chlorellavorus]
MSGFQLEDFQAQLDFPLDDFQQEAIRNISEGHSVVVCAPTGSGKTIIAEYAAMRALAEGKKIFYTTPLKALSNQKYFDLKKQYGEANVGLLTGDSSFNRDARIIVMTTEIFRNMLYGIEGDSSVLSYLGYVVLDECHYMNDSERGTVWEECIIYCPDNIQLIALSATVANAAELTDWINEVHHDTRLIWSDFRPVPLRFSFYDRDRLLPLFEPIGADGQKKLNRKLKLDLKGQRFAKGSRFFRPNELISAMAEKDMLPAIFFTFSRKDCDKHLEYTFPLKLLSPAERKQLERKVDEFVAQNPFLESSPQIKFIRNGFASHHAGLLPAMKHLVETLFQQGLIKVVFATETLAAGINMPARSTVITKISKRTNDGHRILTASEFLQMSGRAGRRGMDDVGYVIIVSSQYEGAQEAATLASSPPEPLNSQFTPTYGMVLNLLQKHSLEQAEFLIRQSFGQFTAARRLRPLEESKAHHEAELQQLLGFKCPVGVTDKDFHGYLRAKELVHETARFVRILQKQLKQHGNSPEVHKQLNHEQGKLNNLRATINSSPCNRCDVLRKHERVEERIQREQRKLKTVNRLLEEENNTHWRRFMNIYALLRETEYLNEQDKPTRRGELTAQIRSENEYAMAEILLAVGVIDDLTAPQLAALVSALLNDSNRENLYVKFHLSNAVGEALNKVDLLLQRVDRLQRKHKVAVGLILNPVASGLVEAWAMGWAWERLTGITNIGEGDIVRLLRRTADILRQISRIDTLPLNIRLTAKEALKLIDREPIKEIELIEEPVSVAVAATSPVEPATEAGQLLPFPSVDSLNGASENLAVNADAAEESESEPEATLGVDSFQEALPQTPELPQS